MYSWHPTPTAEALTLFSPPPFLGRSGSFADNTIRFSERYSTKPSHGLEDDIYSRLFIRLLHGGVHHVWHHVESTTKRAKWTAAAGRCSIQRETSGHCCQIGYLFNVCYTILSCKIRSTKGNQTAVSNICMMLIVPWAPDWETEKSSSFSINTCRKFD